MNPTKRKRITMKLKKPNPLFEQWLTEWRDKARESESKMQYCFGTALKSLKKYPLPLQSGKDCKILTGFGDKLCSMLDEKLLKHKSENGGLVIPPENIESDNENTKAKVKKTTKKANVSSSEYIPQYRSGPYAILITLYEKSLEPNYVGFLTKKEIIEFGQALCDKSFTRPDPETRYTSWSSMKTLIDKKLVEKKGNPAKFSLTATGNTLSEQLYIQSQVDKFVKENNDSTNMLQEKKSPPKEILVATKKQKLLVGNSALMPSSTTTSKSSSSRSMSSQSLTTFDSVILTPHSFEILLLVDNKEVFGNRSEDDPLLQELKILNVVYEIRDLKVGDFLWICRDTATATELVLPYIVERKRMDDFGKSIKDGRFHEQKFRLKQSGVTNLIYLVESYGRNEHVGLPLSTLQQAATNTLVQDGFTVKFTNDIRSTCQYLACMSNLISKLFRSKTIVSCLKEDVKETPIEDDLICLMHFTEFNKSSAKVKQLKVKDMFVKQLIQIKGLSVDKALGVVEKYPTPKLLKLAYESLTPMEGEKLLADILCGSQRKKFGAGVSKTVYQFFCKNVF